MGLILAPPIGWSGSPRELFPSFRRRLLVSRETGRLSLLALFSREGSLWVEVCGRFGCLDELLYLNWNPFGFYLVSTLDPRSRPSEFSVLRTSEAPTAM